MENNHTLSQSSHISAIAYITHFLSQVLLYLKLKSFALDVFFSHSLSAISNYWHLIELFSLSLKSSRIPV